MWKKTYAETLQGFDFDPFDCTRIAFRCIECILFIDDFSHTRTPTSGGKKFYVVGPNRGSPVRDGGVMGGAGAGDGASSQDDKGKAARTRIKRLMKEFVMGEAQSTHGDTLTLSECLQVKINSLFCQY